jgi:hypothetical protein
VVHRRRLTQFINLGLTLRLARAGMTKPFSPSNSHDFPREALGFIHNSIRPDSIIMHWSDAEIELHRNDVRFPCNPIGFDPQIHLEKGFTNADPECTGMCVSSAKSAALEGQER